MGVKPRVPLHCGTPRVTPHVWQPPLLPAHVASSGRANGEGR